MSSRRIAVRRSGVHGKGVFALEAIAAGERLTSTRGNGSPGKKRCAAIRMNRCSRTTLSISRSTGQVIDGKVNGNSSNWINHSCVPNCEAEESTGACMCTHCAIR